jgi:hypothetical protein
MTWNNLKGREPVTSNQQRSIDTFNLHARLTICVQGARVTVLTLIAALVFVIWSPGEDRYGITEISWP